VDSGFASSDTLVQNNICQRVATCAITEGDSGSVIAYNFSVNDYYTGSSGVWQQEDEYHHSAGDHLELYEGNIGPGFTADDIHGSSFMITIFREYLTGRDTTAKTQQTNAVHLYAYSRFFHVIGSVLGTSGYHTTYTSASTGTTDSASTSTSNLSVYVLNYSGDQGQHDSTNSIPNDLNTSASLMRWGNYDTVNAAVRWVSGEVPSGIAKYSTALPASHTLPASFYLSAKPAWFGSVAWPAIGPDVTSGNISGVGGFANKTPAMVCYLSTMSGPADGSGSVLTFNANSCYSGSPPASVPNRRR
jgi:hypothetical protein